MAEMLARFFADDDEGPQRDLLLRVAMTQVLARGVANRSEQVRHERLDVPFSVMIESESTTPFLELIWRTLKSMEAKNRGWCFPMGPAAGEAVPSRALLLTSVQLEQYFGGEQSPSLASLYEEILSTCNGLEISRLVFTSGICFDSVENEAANAQAAGNLYERVLCASGCASGSQARLGKVNLLCSPQHADDFFRFCSAVAATRTTKQLELRLDPLERFEDHDMPEEFYRHLQWMAFALFSKYAQRHSSVVDVALKGLVLTTEDVDGMAAVLKAQDPTKELFGCQPLDSDDRKESESTRLMGMLKQGTTARLVPMHPESKISSEHAAWELSRDVCDVMRLRRGDDGETIHVLVPGYGVCKVKREDFIQTPTAQLGGGGVTSLRLDSQGPPRATRNFIELIGAPLTRLVLHLPDGGAEIVPYVLKACPKLKALVLKNGVIDTDLFLEACHQHRLGIEELDCHFDNNCRLMKELADELTRLAQTLKRLTYIAEDDGEDNGDHDDDGSQDGCTLNMLRDNRKLEFLGVMMHFAAYDVHRLKTLSTYDNEILPVAREPLRVNQRLAILSVFASNGSTENKFSCVQEEKRAKTSTGTPLPTPTKSTVLSEFPIDRHVISLIFQFAAPCVHRRVHVHFYR